MVQTNSSEKSLNDVYNMLTSINDQVTKLALENQMLVKLQLLDSKIITSAGVENGIILNASYYYDIVFELLNGTTTDTIVYINAPTSQNQQVAKIRLNSTNTRVRLQGVSFSQIYTDSSIGSSSIYVYYVGYNWPKRIELDASQV